MHIVIIDAHVHVWRRDLSFPDPAATTVSPASDIPVQLLKQYLDAHQVERAVLVQPLFPGEDNNYICECRDAAPERFAAVCVVDPRKPSAANQLEYWVTQRGCRGLRLRPRVAAEQECFGSAQTKLLWQTAERLGVVVSLLANLDHLRIVCELAAAHPGVPIIIDHLAHPDVALPVTAPELTFFWQLAQRSNVFWKVSGFAYYSRQPYPYADCRTLLRALYEQCGAQRLLWGSDFPHVVLKTTYGRSLAAISELMDYLSAGELGRIRYQNALDLYWPEP